VDVRDLADVAVAALTTSEHKNRIYSLTGPDALTFVEMADALSRAVGRTISFVDVPPESMRSTLVDLGLPAWQADGLLEEFAMYRRGEASEVDQACVRPWVDLLVHLTNSRVTTPRSSVEEGQSRSVS